MSDCVGRDPSTVSDWSNDRRKQRLHDTRIGSGLTGVRRILLLIALASVPMLLVCGQYWTRDVAPERARLAQTQPQIFDIDHARDTADTSTAVVDMVGLGNIDASDTARTLTSLDLIGRVWAIRYDDGGIDTKVISDIIVDKAQGAKVKRVVLVGHSMGGVIALEVAQHIYRDTAIDVLGVVLDCTPLDLDGVRPESRDAGEELLRWIGWVPGARESRTLRFAVEVAAREDRFVHRDSRGIPRVAFGDLKDVVGEVLRDKILSADVASNGLIASQFITIVASGAVDNLKSLATEREDKPRPAVVFLRPRNALADNVVDDDLTQKILVERSGGQDGTLLVAKLDNTGHANPNQRPVEYNTAIADRIVPFLQQISAANASREELSAGRR
ncbi:alpha/beta fold hydrolase [Antrihabitans cavernicola]|uniref:Alpha/beta fold hydrolase n=1 Tax=Antrihabitans cavernicola TaxID=2495913 RepID=A0A5A7S7W6_9NOCA|nr:alpha/beta hydrolase [Spelaeibacter cavernicola]KAA0021027.1 alpha/beta fold hydrolase [Spelaeibacter cavernicola]